jgi:hypothetical protein
MRKKTDIIIAMPASLRGFGPAHAGIFDQEKTVDFLLSCLLTCLHVSGAFGV